MTTNTGDNYDPAYPYGIDFESIGVEETPDTSEVIKKVEKSFDKF